MTTPSSNDNLYSVDGVQAKAREYLAKLDSELSQYKYCNELERRTGVPKSYVVLGGGAVIFVMVFFNLAGKFLTSLISWAYPGTMRNLIHASVAVAVTKHYSLRVIQGNWKFLLCWW